MAVRLNGWQRIWVVAAVLSFGFASLFVYATYQSPSEVEDPQILAQLNADEVIDVEIAGLGRVKFPKDMPEKDIEALIQENIKENPTKIPGLAKAKIGERNEEGAASARKANDAVRKANREILLLGYGGWLGFIIFLYVAGWSIGWIYRGFKAT